MKNIIFYTSTLLLMISTNACKKSENDPFISLSSRNNRIEGNWKLFSMESERHQSYINEGDTSTTFVISSISNDELITNINGTSKRESYAENLKIEKNGTVIQTISTNESTQETTGQWYWVDNADGKKTGIVILGETFIIERLSRNEFNFCTEEKSSELADSITYQFSQHISYKYIKNQE